MPRAPRLVVPGQPLHVIQRGNNRAVCFTDVADFLRYRQILRESSEDTGCAVHAYVFMTNHVHLLVTPPCGSAVARMMQAVGRRYVRYFNDRRTRTGTLWEGRYRSAVIDSQSYFFACSRYIELNPTRAGMTADPGAYAWSSFRSNANGRADALVTPHAAYLALDAGPAARRDAYRAMFAAELPAATVDTIRRATNAGAALGSGPSPYRPDVETATRRQLPHLQHGGDRRSARFRHGAAQTSTTLTP